MKRRSFLKKTAAAVAVSSVGPLFLGAENKAGTKKAVIGTGAHQYECNHDWGTLPGNIHWETTHGVAVDEEGLIYVKQQGHGKNTMDTIVVFDPTGKYVRSFARDIYPGGHGIDLRKEGGEQFLYLCDVAHGQVQKTTLKGDIVWKKVGPPPETDVYKKGFPYKPTNVAFAPDGGFYIGDGYGSNFIHQYDKDAKYVRTWGGAGKEPGKMQTPHGLWLDDRKGREPSLVVADRANARLQYFTLDGKHLGFNNDVLFPAHFDIRGEVLMVPDLHCRVTLFDKNNKVIVHLGDDPEPEKATAWRKKVLDKFKVRSQPEEWQAGRFIHPHDACFDKDGNIYVVEWVATGRITFLRHLS